MAKYRLDTVLLDKGMAPSREKARAMILAGEVKVDNQSVTKAGTKIDEDAEVTVTSNRLKYVSRGGFKLEGAIRAFYLDFQGKSVLDVGASTGGYTDCALQNGASRVCAVDVGYGQLDWSLRNDPRVKVMERTNVRYFTLKDLGEQVDMITMDVSFISTTLIFPVLAPLIKDEGAIVSLIKPQFEAGRDKVGKKGVVRDPLVHVEVLRKCTRAARNIGLNCLDVTYSPITGPQGNIEYFILLKKNISEVEDIELLINHVVEQAHHSLEGQHH
ncbi:MAG: TlyA family RNA methyltransferase [Bacillota bacterium]|nr:TlyA family RNA methyltransferase [Bacillota bacterium]